MTLAEMIHQALEGKYIVFANSIHSPHIADHIAAAVVAWMQSDAAVERMARTFDADAFNYFDVTLPYTAGSVMNGYRVRQLAAKDRARAAIAALAPDAGGGR